MNLLITVSEIDWWVWAIVIGAILLLIAIIIIGVVVSKKKRPVAEEKPVEKAPKYEAEEKPEPIKSKPVVNSDDSAKEKKQPAGKVYHISKRKDDGKWQIKAEGGVKAIKLFQTQSEAISYAKTLADNQDARIMIHKEDGSFRKLTY